MKRKKKEEHPNHERWLVSYADFITLLFAFFVVMFAAANMDKNKARELARAMQAAFSNVVVFNDKTDGGVVRLQSPQSQLINPSDNNVSPQNVKQYANPTFMIEDKEVVERLDRVPFGEIKPAQDIEEAYRIITAMIEKSGLQNVLTVKWVSKGIKVYALSALLFPPGGDKLTSAGQALLERIGTILASLPNYLLIEAYTDNTPVSGKFTDNQTLSQARADYVRQKFIDDNKISGAKVLAVGRGELFPIAPNDTATNKERNRRLELTVLKSEKIDKALTTPSSSAETANGE